MNRLRNLPFRLGTTSYIWPDDILPNVRQLALLVDDVELVLFETDEYGSNLPDPATIAELGRIAADHDLTYTVHLPLDLRLADPGAGLHPSLDKARRVIERTLPLNPFAYVLHLDGKAIMGAPDAETLAGWQAQAAASLEQVAAWAGGARRLCVENLENYDPASLRDVLDRVPASRCIDVGHLWLLGQDPLAHLREWQERARVIHLHGVVSRDHQSLAAAPPGKLDPVVAHFLAHLRGVVTLEVFGLEDFESSHAAFAAAVERLI